jgi:hypothetical protein
LSFSRWLEEHQLSAADLSNDRLEQLFFEVPRRTDCGGICSRRALTQVLEVLEGHGLAHRGASEALLVSCERFLLQERVVVLLTVAIYLARFPAASPGVLRAVRSSACGRSM